MNEAAQIFRQEALEASAAGQRVSGEPLRADSSWVRWSYFAVLALVVAGLVTAIMLRTEATTTGTAVVHRDGTFSAVVPAAAAAELQHARSVRIESLPGGDRVGGAATITRVAAADATSLSRHGLTPLDKPGIMVFGTLVHTESSPLLHDRVRSEARVVVVLRSESLIATVGRRLDGMLG